MGEKSKVLEKGRGLFFNGKKRNREEKGKIERIKEKEREKEGRKVREKRGKRRKKKKKTTRERK